MKKLPLFLLALTPILISTFLVSKTNAAGFYDGHEWWMPSEVASYFQEKNAERETLCQDDSDCHNQILDDLMANDNLYRIGYQVFMGSRFLITSINRSNNTVEIYFNNDDINISKYNPGWRDSDLLTLFLGWFDGEARQIYDLTDNTLFDSDPNRHILYSETYLTMGRGWLPSQNFVSVGLNEDINATDYLAYFAHSGIYYSKGIIDLSHCKEDPNWGNCDLLISDDGETRFFAPGELEFYTSPEIPPDDVEEPIENPDEPIIIDEPRPNPEPGPQPEEPVSESATSEPEVLEPVSVTAVDSLVTNTFSENSDSEQAKADILAELLDIPLVGNTASLSPKSCSKIDFPWWFLAMIVVGDIIAVWIFMPSRHQRIK